MFGGQTLAEAPFVGFLGGVKDSHSPNFLNFLQAPFGTGFPNHASSSTFLLPWRQQQHGSQQRAMYAVFYFVI